MQTLQKYNNNINKNNSNFNNKNNNNNNNNRCHFNHQQLFGYSLTRPNPSVEKKTPEDWLNIFISCEPRNRWSIKGTLNNYITVELKGK